jgi:phage protein D
MAISVEDVLTANPGLAVKPLRAFTYEHIDQTDESDIHFLTRIGKGHDAIASVKGQTLLFVNKGEGKTASGIPMIPRPITKSGGQ